jgi:quercetin dioxygenase-like cupin family protein
MKRSSMLLFALAVIGMGAISEAGAQTNAVTPDQLKFNRNPATGSEIAVVMGNPREAGPNVLRVRYPAGLKAMPHSHPNDTYVTVISGVLRYAEGEKFDESRFKDYPAGSFFVIPANVPHYENATAPMEFQAHGMGPIRFIFVDPQHDPASKK